MLITDEPMYFLGGGSKDAKPRAGYEVGVIQMEVDAAGSGTGSVAAAAKVKPGEDGVVVDDYGDQRIEIAKDRRRSVVVKPALHSTSDASPLAALLLPRIFPIFSVVAPGDRGASLVSVRRGGFTTG